MIQRVIDGRYEIVGEIDRGGFAIVYRAKDRRLHDRLVAIKCLRSEYAENPGVLAMWQAEIKVSSAMQYPGIAQIFDTVQEGKDYFVILEYVDGPSLKNLYLRAREQPDPEYSRLNGRRVPPNLAAYIAREICLALHYAHSIEDSATHRPLGLVHRDVSPQNVLVSYNGEVKLTDFGIAKVRSGLSDETRTGVVKGKYSYMSPEQIQGLHVDHTSDLYAVGIVLYEALSGEKLYSADTEMELMKRVAAGGIDREHLESTAIPAELRGLLDRALQPDRNARYKSGLEMADDLSSFLGGARGTQQELARYVRALFSPAPAKAAEETRVLPPDSDPPAAAAAIPTLAGTAGAEPTATVAATPVEPPVEIGERTIMDVVRVAAYSGRKFFGVIAAVLGVLLVVFTALDTFPDQPPWKRRTAVGRLVRGLIFPVMAKVETYPPGARVFVNGKLQDGVTPTKVRRAKVGWNSFTFELSGYHPFSRSVSLVPSSGRETTVTYSFKVPVDISTTPQGATIVWDLNQLADTTPLTGFEQEMRGKPVPFELRRPGFVPLAGEFDFADTVPAASTDRFLTVERKKDDEGFYFWSIRGSFAGFVRLMDVRPPDADVTITLESGERKSWRPKEEPVKKVPWGKHTLVARKPGYQEANRQFVVTKGDTITLLQIALGVAVRISVVDSLTGVRVGTMNLVREPGLRTVTVSAEGYQSRDTTIRVPESGPAQLTVKLLPGGVPNSPAIKTSSQVRIIVKGYDDKPLPGVQVVAVPVGGGDEVPLGTTDENGRLEAAPRQGSYTFKTLKGSGTWYPSLRERTMEDGNEPIILYFSR